MDRGLCPEEGENMVHNPVQELSSLTRRRLLQGRRERRYGTARLASMATAADSYGAERRPAGQMTWAMHITLAPDLV